MPIFAIFLVIPLIEIALFITIGGWLTLWPTLGLVVLTAVIGALLVRRQGIAVLRQLQTSMERLSDPLTPLGHGAMIVMAGMFLITPGFLTDTFGFALLVPAVRAAILRFLAARVVVLQAARRGPGGHPQARDDIIDAEFHEVSPDASRVPGPDPRKRPE